MVADPLIDNENEDRLLPERFPDEAPVRSSWGAVIGVGIIIVMLLVGALYFWGAHLETLQKRTPPPYIPSATTTTVTILATTSTSTLQ